MKKNIIAASATAVLLMTGCTIPQSSSSKSPTASGTASVSEGSWQVSNDLAAAELPDDAQKALEQVMAASTDGGTFQPIALLARQAVSGTNYEILGFSDDSSAASSLEVVTIYENLEGNAEITGNVMMNLADVTDQDHEYKQEPEAVGAWETNTDGIAQDDKSEKAPTNGNKIYTTVVVLGKNGDRTASLCFEKAVLKDGSRSYCYAIITDSIETDGETKMDSVYEIDPADWAGSQSTWYVNPDLSSAALPEEAQKAFDGAAVSTENGEKAKAIVLLGTKKTDDSVIYSILADLHDADTEEASFEVVEVRLRNDGSTGCVFIIPFDLADFTDRNHFWNYDPNADNTGKYKPNAVYAPQEQYNTGSVDFVTDYGSYHAVALLGNAAGTETDDTQYAVLCVKEAQEEAELNTACFAVLTVASPISDELKKTKVKSVYELNPDEFGAPKISWGEV